MDTVLGLIQSAVDALGSAIDPWGYVLLFALCLLEASAFVGLVIPGESALLLAGVLAQEGRLSLPGCIVCAVTGAILGDSLGYEIGRHLGPRLRSTWFGRKVGEERWQRAHDYVHRMGGRAIFFGRWIGLLRALVPAIAGDARMPYGRFLFWNVLGAIVSAPTVILLGYAAGSSYHVVEKRLGQVTWALLGLVVAFIITRHILKRRASTAEQQRS
jgi:membrane protein DedA with SNARE-associated domain